MNGLFTTSLVFSHFSQSIHPSVLLTSIRTVSRETMKLITFNPGLTSYNKGKLDPDIKIVLSGSVIRCSPHPQVPTSPGHDVTGLGVWLCLWRRLLVLIEEADLKRNMIPSKEFKHHALHSTQFILLLIF